MIKDMAILNESPFADKGSISEIFSENLTVWKGIKGIIDEINVNTAA